MDYTEFISYCTKNFYISIDEDSVTIRLLKKGHQNFQSDKRYFEVYNVGVVSNNLRSSDIIELNILCR